MDQNMKVCSKEINRTNQRCRFDDIKISRDEWDGSKSIKHESVTKDKYDYGRSQLSNSLPIQDVSQVANWYTVLEDSFIV